MPAPSRVPIQFVCNRRAAGGAGPRNCSIPLAAQIELASSLRETRTCLLYLTSGRGDGDLVVFTVPYLGGWGGGVVDMFTDPASGRGDGDLHMFTVPYLLVEWEGGRHVYCALPLGGEMGIYTCLLYLTFGGGGYVDIFTVPYLEGGGGRGGCNMFSVPYLWAVGRGVWVFGGGGVKKPVHL